MDVTKTDNNLRPKRHFDVRMRDLFGRRLLLRVHVTMETNEVGLKIWSLCDGTRTADEIASSIAQDYGIDAVTARTDVDEFLASLTAAQFLSWEGQ
jgi:hypothetical protein